MLVEQRKWMTAEEFNDAYALCQFLPGPNVVNLSVVFGRRIRGPVGAAVALVGLARAAVRHRARSIGLLYARFGEIAALQRMLARGRGGGRRPGDGNLRQDGAAAVQGSARPGAADRARDLRGGRRDALAALLGARGAGAG